MFYKHSIHVLRLSSRVTQRLLADVVGKILVWPTLIGGLTNFVSPCGDANQTNSVFDGFNFSLLEAIQLFIAATQDSVVDAATKTSLYRQCIYNIYLIDIRICMQFTAVSSNDVIELCGVNYEQEWSKDRTLRNAEFQWN